MSCRHNRRSGRVSCNRHWRFRKYACLCEDWAMSNQRSQQIKTYHHVHLLVALRWLWSNSVTHLMMRTCCLSRHPFRSLTHMQQLWSPNTRIFLSFCYKAHSHHVYIVPGRANASNIQRCPEDTGPCLLHNILFAHAYGAVWHHCTYVRHQQECTTEENNISADDTFMQNAGNFWGITVETTTTAGGQ